MQTKTTIDVKPTRRKRTFAAFVGAISLAVLIPASGAFAAPTQPNACVGQHIQGAIAASGNVEAHADFHDFSVQQLLDFIREVKCGR